MDEQLFVPPTTNPAPPPSQTAPTPPPPPSTKPTPPPVAPPPTPAAVIPRRASPIKGILITIIVLLVISAIGYGVYSYLQKSKTSQNKTITYWGLWEPEAAIRPIFEEYERTHPNIKIDYKSTSLKEYRERLSSALNQGKGPDIFRIHNSWVPMFKGDLSPVPSTVYSTSSYESTFYPSVKDTLKSGANYIAIPLEYDGLAMYVNDNLLQETGLPIPTSWDELRKVAIAMTKCQSDTGTCGPNAQILISGASLGTASNVDHWQDVVGVLMLQNTAQLANPTGQAASDVVSFYTSFSKQYFMWNSNLPSSTTQFSAGKVGIYFGPSWRYFDIKATNPNLKFSIHPIPQLPIDPERGEKPINWASFWVEGVNAKSAAVNESWELLKYLSSVEVMEKLHQLEIQSGREFGEPYSRVDLAEKLSNVAPVKAYISQAPLARTWYLSSAADDGKNGISNRISQAYADVIDQKASLGGLPAALSTILSQYGLSTATP